MKLNISLPYYRQKNDTSTVSTPEITLNYILTAINSKYPQGIEGQLRRMWGRIQRKLEEAIEKDDRSVELDENEFDFIKKAFEEAKMPIVFARNVSILEDELEKCGKKEEKKEK